MVGEIGLSENKQVLAYNQFPLCYGNPATSAIAAMTTQLSILADMNFNATLTNPVQAIAHVPVRKHNRIYSGSLYATASFTRLNTRLFSTNIDPDPSQAECESQLINYTTTAHANHLAPIFDLVLNHIAHSQQAIEELINELIARGTITYNNHVIEYNCSGERVQLAVSHNFTADVQLSLRNLLFINSNSFPDIRKFNYREEVVRRLMIDLVWKPFISRYIRDYKFTGVRIDAIKHIDGNVLREITAYVKQECQEAYGINPIILGEYIGDHDPQRNNTSINTLINAGAGFTHVYDTLYYKSYFSHSNNSAFNDEESGYLSFLRRITTSEEGGTFSFIGNHDFGNSYSRLWQIIGRKPNEIQLKERLWSIALTQNAGYYLFCGDEYGVDRRDASDGTLVFSDQYREAAPYVSEQVMPNNWGGLFNFRELIKEINNVIKNFSAPTTNFFVFHYYDKKNKIDIVTRQQERGNWQSAFICCLDIAQQSDLKPENTSAILHNLAQCFDCTVETLKEKQIHFYFIRGDKAYFYADNSFRAVNYHLPSLSATS